MGLESKVSGGRGGGCQRRMKCERVRCKQGARNCRGGGDAMDCDCVGRVEDDLPRPPTHARARTACNGGAGGADRREGLSLLSLYDFKLGFRADPHRQSKSSHPLFLVAPGTAGLARVAVSTWPGALFLQVPLVWRCPTPHPWEEQNPPMDQRFLIAVWRSLMILWSGAAAPTPVPGDLGFGEEEESLISVSNF